jgi:glycosyltransferase involved in cell wall biosynthesis
MSGESVVEAVIAVTEGVQTSLSEKPTISIFTPSHNPEHLPELYESIRDQEFFEWVIVTNNGCVVPEEIAADERVVVYDYPHEYVGALKAYACSKCVGDILLEVDHDDLLTQDCLSEVANAFLANPDVGFVYSNSANFKDNFQKTERFADGNGWEYRPFMFRGNELDELVSFDDHPCAMSRIWFAPNHLRAWRRSVYEAIGGHNTGMRVLDDQDLISRTAIATKTFLIDKCLYLYRITGNNTWLVHNKEIQDNVMPIHTKYIEDISIAWSARYGLKALDLGGRFHRKEGLTSVDLKDADINTDLNFQWPFEDNSVGVIIANDILEHLKNPIHAMKEAYRVLVDGGIFLIQVPSTDGRGAFQDPTHVSFWNENSFWYYTRATQASYIDTPVRFQEVLLQTIFPSDWHKNANISYVVAHLVALKGSAKLPGWIGI